MFWRVKLIMRILTGKPVRTSHGTVIECLHPEGMDVPARIRIRTVTPNMVFTPEALSMFSADEVVAIIKGHASPVPGTYRVEGK